MRTGAASVECIAGLCFLRVLQYTQVSTWLALPECSEHRLGSRIFEVGFFSSTPNYCRRCGRTRQQYCSIESITVDRSTGYALCDLCVDNREYEDRVRPETQKLRKRIESKSQDIEAYCSLGRLLIPDALRRNPRNIEAFVRVGFLIPREPYRQQIKYPATPKAMQESYDLLIEALRLGPRDPVQRGSAFFNLGMCTLWLTENCCLTSDRRDDAEQYLKMAEKEFELALSFEPDNEDMLSSLLEVYRRLAFALGNEQYEKRCNRVADRLKEIKAKKSIGLSSGTAKPRLSSQQKGLAFEAKCMRWLQLDGFGVQSTSTTGDGGVDIVATCTKPIVGGTYVIQCKNWEKPVDEPTVRDLGGVVEKWKAVKGILISNSGFTSAAQSFVKGMRLELVDGRQLDYLLSLVSKKN